MDETKYKDLQVSGSECFSEHRWREAVLYYLFGIWGDKQEVTYRPKISFGNVTLRLDLSTAEYYAYGVSTPELHPEFTDAEILQVESGKQNDVEAALARFVKNDGIRLLIITLPLSKNGALALWKKYRRGQYGYESIGLPKSWGTGGRFGVNETARFVASIRKEKLQTPPLSFCGSLFNQHFKTCDGK